MITNDELRRIERRFLERVEWKRGTAPLGDQLRPEITAAMAREILDARELLTRIRGSRVAFALDPGGPADPATGMEQVEKWIDEYSQSLTGST